jgi:ABC-type multidrug transport system permease subunit
MASRARQQMRRMIWRVLVIAPLVLVFLIIALILPLTFLSFFGHEWLAKNPLNSWVLGALIYTTTCYILSTSPGIIRIGEWMRHVDRSMSEDHTAPAVTKR